MSSARMMVILLIIVFVQSELTMELGATDNLLTFGDFRSNFYSPEYFGEHWLDKLPRVRRQAKPRCKPNQFRCWDGSCIKSIEKCDGIANCLDKTDETIAACQSISCPSYLFRCSYGACVDADGKCNQIQDCADNSDELHIDCIQNKKNSTCGKRKYQCDNSDCIDSEQLCDGRRDCVDGSDETITSCSNFQSCPPFVFRCAYGACVDGDSKCNDVLDCADGSDESADLCNRTVSLPPIQQTTTVPTTTTLSIGCILPDFVENGNYISKQKLEVVPGRKVPPLTLLEFSCKKGYSLEGPKIVHCTDSGAWSDPIAQCIRMCNPQRSLTVDLTCTRAGVIINCDEKMSNGSTITTECKRNHVQEINVNIKKIITCLEGSWDRPIPVCIPECGEERPEGVTLTIHGKKVKRGSFPWHAGIYVNSGTGLTQICGGTILKSNIIITAAHCFWDSEFSEIQDPLLYHIAVGKIYRDYNSVVDENTRFVQKSPVLKIEVPKRYYGPGSNEMYDIALLILVEPLVFSKLVLPACLNLIDTKFDTTQTTAGSLGKGAGWGVTSEGGLPSEELKYITIPVVDYVECRNVMPPQFIRLLTDDKFCAGYLNGTGMCSGDSGGGLLFSSSEHNSTRWFLRGIVSVGVASETSDTCRENIYSGFTHVFYHRQWIIEMFDQYNTIT